jgi:hypothetical protein
MKTTSPPMGTVGRALDGVAHQILPTAPMQSLGEPASLRAERQPPQGGATTFARNPAGLGVLLPSAAPVGHLALLL